MGSTRFRFTKKLIADLQPTSKRIFYHDTLAKGLFLLVTPGGAKSFYVRRKFRGKQTTLKIGDAEELPIERARVITAETISKIMAGNDVQPKKPKAVIQVESANESFGGDFLTIGNLHAEYVAHLTAHNKIDAVKKSKHYFMRHLWHLKNTELRDLRRREVNILHREIQERSGHHQANRVLQDLRASINFAITDHELDLPNPASKIKLFREYSRTRRLTDEELPAFFKALAEEPNVDQRNFITLLLLIGCRKMNLQKMKWADLDLPNGLWNIKAQEMKGDLDVQIPLIKGAVGIIKGRKGQRKSIYVFPGRFDDSKHINNPNCGWYRILERAGFKKHDLRMHDLRRSLASYEIEAGAPLEIVQKSMTHKNRATTEIYARPSVNPVRQAMEAAVSLMHEKANNT